MVASGDGPAGAGHALDATDRSVQLQLFRRALAAEGLVAAVGIWLTFAAAGFVGLWLLSSLAAAAMVLGWRQLTARPWPILVALLVTLPLFPWTQRPNLLSLALFPTVLALLERRRWAWLVLVSWIWIVLHRAALLGYALILGRALQQLVARLCARWPRLTLLAGAPPAPRELALAGLAAVVAPLVGLLNPSGRAAFTTRWRWSRATCSASTSPSGAGWAWPRSKAGRASCSPSPPCWSSPAWSSPSAGGSARPSTVGTSRSCCSSRSWRRSGCAGCPIFALASALVLLLLVDEAVARLTPRTQQRLPVMPALLLLLLAACLAARRGTPWTLGEDHSVEPAAAVDFARAHQLDGPLLSSFEFGGYLLYRGLPVLVDGRLEQLYPPTFIATCVQAERARPSWRNYRSRRSPGPSAPTATPATPIATSSATRAG